MAALDAGRAPGLAGRLPLGEIGEGRGLALAVQREDHRGDTLEHEAVVGHQHEPALELGERVLEHLERRDVQVVGGLVEDEQVGGLAHEARDQDARLLAAREPADRHLELLGPEQKALGPRGDVDGAALPGEGVALGGEGAAEGLVRIEAGAVLAKAHEAEAVGALDAAGVGLDRPSKEVEQRGLAAAVRPDQADASARGDRRGRDRGTRSRPPSDFETAWQTRSRRVRLCDEASSMPAVELAPRSLASASSR